MFAAVFAQPQNVHSHNHVFTLLTSTPNEQWVSVEYLFADLVFVTRKFLLFMIYSANLMYKLHIDVT